MSFSAEQITHLASFVREARGLESQAAFANRAGISDRTVSLLEVGKLKRPRLPTLIRIAAAAGQDPQNWLQQLGMQAPPSVIARYRFLVEQHGRVGSKASVLPGVSGYDDFRRRLSDRDIEEGDLQFLIQTMKERQRPLKIADVVELLLLRKLP